MPRNDKQYLRVCEVNCVTTHEQKKKKNVLLPRNVHAFTLHINILWYVVRCVGTFDYKRNLRKKKKNASILSFIETGSQSIFRIPSLFLSGPLLTIQDFKKLQTKNDVNNAKKNRTKDISRFCYDHIYLFKYQSLYRYVILQLTLCGFRQTQYLLGFCAERFFSAKIDRINKCDVQLFHNPDSTCLKVLHNTT